MDTELPVLASSVPLTPLSDLSIPRRDPRSEEAIDTVR